jgi:hypothetical protein
MSRVPGAVHLFEMLPQHPYEDAGRLLYCDASSAIVALPNMYARLRGMARVINYANDHYNTPTTSYAGEFLPVATPVGGSSHPGEEMNAEQIHRKLS